jgi:hypothetical protein
LGWLLALILSLGLARAQAWRETLVTNGPAAKRINLVVLSEGYTAGELPVFVNEAREAVNALLATPPFNEYRNQFNAYAIAVPSAESGSDHPARGIFRDTYFNSSFDSFGLARLLTFPPNDRNSSYADGQGKVDQLLREFVPEHDVSVLLVNDTEYGGSGGSTAVFSRNAASAELMIHELGHSFGFLADEYSDLAASPGSELGNVTRETRPDFIKWRAWIPAGTPIPTPETPDYANVIGLFEGANLRPRGWFRPKADCKMRTLDRPFCEVCRQELVRAIYRVLRPIESFAPAATEWTLDPDGRLELSVRPLAPDSHPLAVQWFVGATAVPGETNASLNVTGGWLGEGEHQVRAEVSDPTPLVRVDANNSLRQSQAWTITVQRGLPLARLTPLGWDASQGFTFRVSLATTRDAIIEGSTNLLDWLPLFTNQASQAFFFTDLAGTTTPFRFYRARLAP